jgi:hypothetical protein
MVCCGARILGNAVDGVHDQLLRRGRRSYFGNALQSRCDSEVSSEVSSKIGGEITIGCQRVIELSVLRLTQFAEYGQDQKFVGSIVDVVTHEALQAAV